LYGAIWLEELVKRVPTHGEEGQAKLLDAKVLLVESARESGDLPLWSRATPTTRWCCQRRRRNVLRMANVRFTRLID
jgi:hypothetical protein